MLGFVTVARVTFIIDKKGIVRQVLILFYFYTTFLKGFPPLPLSRDGLDATMNYGAHSKFIEKWLDKLEAEDKAAANSATSASS